MAGEQQAEEAPPGAEAERSNLDLILDIPLSVTVELGRARIPVRQLLGFTAGAVVELTKPAGETLDVLINGKTVARGEAVMVNDKFGVRLTEVVSPHERVEQLR